MRIARLLASTLPFLFLAAAAALALSGGLGPKGGGEEGAAFEGGGPGAGRVFTFDLGSAPFPHAAREGGYDLDGESFARQGHYDDSSSTIFVTPGWTPSARVDLVFFFHGWMSSRAEAIAGFSLFEQFAASGVRALLVVPETGVQVPDSFGGKFEEEGGFARYVRELLGRLDAAGIAPGAVLGSVVLAGHSGAYRVIASILRRGGLGDAIREVWLFDALYAREGAFADWIEGRRGRFICLTSRDSDTASKAEGLAALLAERGIAFVSSRESAGSGVPDLAAPVLFVTSELGHFDLVWRRSEFRDFLATSPGLSRLRLVKKFGDGEGAYSSPPPPLAARSAPRVADGSTTGSVGSRQ